MYLQYQDLSKLPHLKQKRVLGKSHSFFQMTRSSTILGL